MFNPHNLVRNNIRNLKPYSSARDEFKGEANIFLDANENSLGSPLLKWYNRYPDPMQWKIKEKLSVIKQVPVDQIFLGNGSDEPIDLLFRCFCEPGVDEVILFPPTYGMYEVSANINNISCNRVPLTSEFQLDLEALESAIKPNTKIIWICSPNNPSGNSIDRQDIEMVLNNFDGLVVVDEAYINFSRQKSLVTDLADYPNLVVLQTLSKAWGLAGLRVGMAFASAEIVGYLNKVKPPYNISEPVQELALKALDEIGQVNDMILQLVEARKQLEQDFVMSPQVVKIFPSDANFLLVEFTQARGMYDYLVGKGIVVRDRSNVLLCDNCLRITVGTDAENLKLVEAINSFQ
ncbi:MAG: histidinol-phosphate transaminase [Chitinophagaceae bacterium]|jgi:histidinol-phosphate aminotransferase|nr:histidinol-phosphate transaminase [Chitinophagaceae bacterium]